jgi:hypothetical protein
MECSHYVFTRYEWQFVHTIILYSMDKLLFIIKKETEKEGKKMKKRGERNGKKRKNK